ncbi:MAG: fibro-slime domain-containing protein [Solobacterium sp.]|nr:fibro-slime domain-containing protein [Solobacterium sp.]
MRKRNNTHRLALPFLIIITFLYTIHSLVFPAVTMNQNAAEEEPGIVLNDPEENKDTQESTNWETEEENNTETEEPVETSEPTKEAVEEPAPTDEPETTPEPTAVPEETPVPTAEPVTTPEPTVLPENTPEIAAVTYPAAEFEETIKDFVTVKASAEEGTFPEGTKMILTPVEEEEVKDTVEEAVDSKVRKIIAVDITFKDKDGKEVEPLKAINVTMSSPVVKEEEAAPEVVHIDDEGKGTVVEQSEEESAEDEVIFTTDTFSVYVIAYTVDFHYEVDGKTYDFSIAGGRMIRASDLFAMLGMTDEGMLNDIEMIQCSDESLVRPVYIEEDVTVEELLRRLSVAIEYSSDMKETEIIAENAQALHTGEWILLTLKPFESEETLTVKLKDGEEFTVCVRDGMIRKTVISDKGDTYEITVTYDETSGIPEHASLDVSEIRSGTEEYYEYLAGAESALKEHERAENGRFFDIRILNKEGKSMEPASPVDVKISLVNSAADEAVQVVHFTDEPELIDSEKEGDTVSFTAESFSVYGVVTVDDLSDLDGKSFGILNTKGGNDPKGIAMLSNARDNTKLQGKALTVRVEPVGRTEYVYVAQNSSIPMWNFTAAGDGKYYVTVVSGNTLKYLKISGTAVTLVEEAELDDDCRITITPGTGANTGKYKFSTSSGVLRLNGNDFARANTSFNSADAWMNLGERSNLNDDDFVVYTAEKVSVSGERRDDEGNIIYDVKNGDQIILYTRTWNEESKRYDYYAVDYDGKLVKVYESGNTISWVGSKVETMLWNFTEHYYEGTDTPNFYYDLQNAYSGKYIAPQIGSAQFLSDDPPGINLNGRRNNRYSSTILSWDDENYDYASLKVVDGQLVSAPMSKAGSFYFAIMKKDDQADQLSQVETIDSTPFGITMKMQNYGDVDGPTGRSRTQRNVLQNMTYNQWNGVKDLLTKYIEDEYPVSTLTGRSLQELYNEEEAKEVNHLFLMNTYRETGYFEYDSTQNFAHLISSEDDPWFGQERPGGGTYAVGDFVVYNQIASTDESNGVTRRHGQFFPYNDLTEGSFLTNMVNDTDIHGEPLSSLDPRKNEKLYKLHRTNNMNSDPRYVDYFFGMELNAKFMMNESGEDAWGHDLIFEFSGDDDFWLYIDDVLVLDLGGVHSALDGSVNFKTGKVIENGKESTLRERFETAYKAQYPDKTQDEVDEWLNGIFRDGGTVFKNYSGHEMKMYFMERGAGASNLHMRFNLEPYTDGEVQIEKEVTGSENVETPFPFQIWYKPDKTQNNYVLFDVPAMVTIASTQERAPYRRTYTPAGGETYSHVYFVRPGQTISVLLEDEDTEYYVRECAVNTDLFDHVYSNEEELTGTQAGEKRMDYTVVSDTVSGRKKVLFKNHVDQEAVKTLTVTKRLWQNSDKTQEIFSGSGENADNTGFKLRIYIGKDDDGNDILYNTGRYYVRDPQGNYCIYQNGSFVSTGKQNYSELSTTVPEGEWKSEQEKATFHSSPNGTIDKIPAGYSIEIPGLIPDTPYKVEEWDAEIPAGYRRIGYTYTEGQYSPENPGTEENSGEIKAELNHETISVHNRHGYGLTVNKVWSDAPFMASHDDIYFAVYIKGSEEPLEGSVRRVKDPALTARWFFEDLAEGKTLNDYEVYEVDPEDPVVDEDTDIVTDWSSLTKKDSGEEISVGGTANEHGYSQEYTYNVSYDREVLSEEQIANDANFRTDTVSNTRWGLRLVKTDMDGTGLKDAVFVLSDNDSDTKQFVSREDGLIAVAYLEADKEYILTESTAPLGYLSLIAPLKIRIGSDHTVYVNDSAQDPANGFWHIIQNNEPTAENMPEIQIRNKENILRAKKTDAYTGNPMQNVHFALYKEVHASGSDTPMPDYNPMEGYEDLVTDADGIIPKIVLRNSEHPDGLKAGSYYLQEIETPSGYKPLGMYIRITISPTGEVTLQKAVRPNQSGSWTISNISSSTAQMKKTDDVTEIIVKNTPKAPVRIRKLQAGTTNVVLANVEFALYQIGQVENGAPKEGETPLLKARTDANGILNLGGLDDSTTYYLFETETLDGYNLLRDPVIITTIGSGTVRASLSGTQLNCVKKKDGGYDVWEITVYNSTGVVLPHTGGSGTAMFTWIGILMILIAGTLLIRKQKTSKQAG